MSKVLTDLNLLSGKVITDNAQARDILMGLVWGEILKHQEIMSGRSMKIKDFNQRYPEETLPPIVAIIDEYA